MLKLLHKIWNDTGIELPSLNDWDNPLEYLTTYRECLQASYLIPVVGLIAVIQGLILCAYCAYTTIVVPYKLFTIWKDTK